MQVAIAIAAIMLAITLVGSFFIWQLIKKVDPKGKDKSEDPNIQEAQEFLPFEDIRDDMIILGQHRYRAVLSCSSTNYQLKTSGEKEQIELAFQRFLNSITFPITFFLQTKVIDNTDRLNQLGEDIAKTLEAFPGMSDYAEQYMKDMASLNDQLGNNQQKKRYIIITYDDVDSLSELTEEEKVIQAAKELRHRCELIRSNLEAVGVSTSIMNTRELIELIYSSYYRDDYSYSEQIADKECFTLMVNGEDDKFKDMPRTKLLDILLGETISKIQVGNLDADVAGKEALDMLNDLKNKYFAEGGFEGV